MIDLQNISLEERQRLYYNGSHCIYCGRQTEYADSIRVYQESYGMIHYCQNCDAWVNCIPGSDQSFGTVARKTLRSLRSKLHSVYDPLWQKKVSQGTKSKTAQALARKWMANLLGIDIVECHIGYFTDEQCKIAITECEKYFLTVDQVEHQKAMLQYRIEIVYWNAEEYGYEVSEYKAGGMHQLELKHKDGRVLFFDPKKQTGRWSTKKHPVPIEDIEQFIFTHFSIKTNEKDIIFSSNNSIS